MHADIDTWKHKQYLGAVPNFSLTCPSLPRLAAKITILCTQIQDINQSLLKVEITATLFSYVSSTTFNRIGM